jgi:hypothetical protein
LIEEHSGSARPEEEKTAKPRREESKTSGIAQIVEVSTITHPVVLATLSNQSIQSNESTQSILTSISAHTQSGNLGISMEDEMRLPIFRGDGSKDTDQHWFLCKAVWSINNVNDEEIKRAQFRTTLRDHALSWYMNCFKGVAQPKPLNEIKNGLSGEFKKPKSESQCITKLK